MSLEEMVKEIEKVTQSPISSLIESQINKFIREGFTYEEIYKCFTYFYVIKHNDVSRIQQYGIGIIPIIRKEANIYFNNLNKKKNIQVDAAKQVAEENVEERTYKPIRRIFNKGGVDINEL